MVIENLNFFDKFGNNLNLDYNSEGEFWEGTIFFPEISTFLYDNENIFILEEVDPDYKFPMLSPGESLKFEWNDNEIEDELFVYEVEKDFELNNFFINRKESIEVSYDDILPTSDGSQIDIKLPLQLNVAFNPSAEVKYERMLCMFLDNGTTKTKVAEISFYGEGTEEDERFGVWIRNFGIKFNKEDANILKNYDIKEAFPDWTQLNAARKNLLVNKDQVYPYIGTYKGLSNFVNLLGYKDVLQIKEYWKNINKKSAYYEKQALVDITDYLDDGKIDNMNILDKNKNIKFGNQFKKTECLALVYQFTKETDTFDDDGIPEVEETTEFTVDEIFYKLHKLKDKVKNEFLPVNVKIKDIIGEFVYFQKITIKFWKDSIEIDDYSINDKAEVRSYPDENVDFTLRSLNPLLRREHQDGYPFGYPILNPGVSNPFDNAQKYIPSDIPTMLTYIREFYTEIKNQRFPNLGKRLTWEDGDDPERLIGAPAIFNVHTDRFTFENFKGVTFESLENAGANDPYYTLENVEFRNFYEITWRITKPGPNPYNFVYRGLIKDLHELPHILPYAGEYRVTIELHDFYGTTSVFSKFVTVASDQKPHIVGMSRLEDKFNYQVSNLNNVRLIDFGTSTNFYPKVNVLDNENAHTDIDIDKNLMQWKQFYYNRYGTGQNMYDVDIYNEDTNEYLKYNDPFQKHPKKDYWGLGENKIPMTLNDYKNVQLKDMYHQRLSDLMYVDDFKAGFYMRHPKPGKQIVISLFTPYVIPEFSSLDELIQILNDSIHPGIRLFNYEIINGRESDGQFVIHAQGEYLSKEMYHILSTESSGSPGKQSSSPGSGVSDTDKYTFFLPRDVYSKRTIEYLESISPVFDPETLFLHAKTSDLLTGAAQDPSFWVDNKYWKFEDNEQTGYLPTVIDQNSFNINDIKVFDSSFNLPRYGNAFFVVNNIDGKTDFIWTLFNHTTGEEVVRVKSVPFFVWKFKDLGRFTLKVEVFDNRGTVYVNQIDKMINVLDKNQYIKNIEDRLNRRKHKLLN